MTGGTALFDLDGTLTDPAVGITSCIAHALESLGAPVPARDELKDWIGAPLRESFADFLSSQRLADEALDSVIAYVKQVRNAISQPVTVADNYEWWIEDGAPLAAEVDFLGIHTYPAWEEKSIDEALAYTVENLEDVRAALPNKPMAGSHRSSSFMT